MTALMFTYPGNEDAAAKLAALAGYETGKISVHHFPDGESLVRLDSDVTGRDVVLYCSLDKPDEKAMTIMFLADTARELGAKSVALVAPYLGYMRQDKRFNAGEAITSAIFAKFICAHFDTLITVDPHLHRHKTMGEIYTIPAPVVHAADAIAGWIAANVDKPVLIGPDEESDQWVRDVANKAALPFTVLTKTRRGDADVSVSVPEVDKYRDHTPVLVDDIISTARTMIATADHLQEMGLKPPVCIGVHAVFAGDGYGALKNADVARIVTCNTIAHETNDIDITPAIAASLADKLAA